MLNFRLERFLDRFRPKKIDKPRLCRPSYFMRHSGEKFFIIGNGPTISDFRDQIFQYIEKYRPITMGANNIGEFYHPDYHAFTNRNRFYLFSKSIDASKSKVLLGAYLTKHLIRTHYKGPYERLMYAHDNEAPFGIDDGVILASCRSIGALLIGVALAMGAAEVNVVGFDGWLHLVNNDKDIDYYPKNRRYNETVPFFEEAERIHHRYLSEIRHYMREKGLKPFEILTPTVYKEYYRDIRTLL